MLLFNPSSQHDVYPQALTKMHWLNGPSANSAELKHAFSESFSIRSKTYLASEINSDTTNVSQPRPLLGTLYPRLTMKQTPVFTFFHVGFSAYAA